MARRVPDHHQNYGAAVDTRDCIGCAYVFMIAWNEFLFAFMFLDDVKLFTLSRHRLCRLGGTAPASDGWSRNQ